MPDKLLTTRELEGRLQLDRVTIYRMVKDGELPALRVGGQWRFSANAIDTWLDGRGQKTTDSASAPIVPDPAGLRLADLVSIATLQSIQDQFAQLLGVAAFITDLDGQPFAPCSRCSRFCQLVHTTQLGMASCQQSWRAVARLDEEGANVHTCHANIRYASAQVVVNGQRVGMVTAGQFLTEAPASTAFRERALVTGARIGVDGEALATAQDSLEIVSAERALQITALLAVIANALSGISYQGYLARQALARIAEISGATPPELMG
jgi:excisionase family DNA binding protein